MCSDWLTFGARCGFGCRSRTSARFSERESEREDRRPGESSRSPSGSVARRNSNGLFTHEEIFFPIAPVDFQSIGGRGGGRGGGFRTFFFFSRGLGAGRGEGDPETRGTSCAIPSWNVPKLIFGEVKRKKCHQKYCSIKRSMKKCHQKYRSIKRSLKKCHQKYHSIESVTKNYAISVTVSLIKICQW